MLAAYPMLFAGGATVIARFAERHSRWILQSGIATCVLVGGLGFAPIALPLLPPEATLRFVRVLSPPQVEKGATARLPQWLADRFGWEAMASSVAAIHRSLPEREQGQTLVLAENYGEAGALELLGREHNLPSVLSPHNTFHVWSLAADEVESYIAIGFPEEELRSIFGQVTQAGLHTCTYCMDYENELPIYVCRGARSPFDEWWPEMRWYGGARK
jgi:hypothetical protein